MNKIPSLLFFIISLCFQDTPIFAEKLKLGISGSSPFRIVENSEITGISMEIWQEIAKNENLEYEVKSYPTIKSLLDAIDQKEIDIGIGPISITAERVEKFWFTQPYYSNNLAILTYEGKLNLLSFLEAFFDKNLFYGIGVLVFVLFIVGNVVRVFEIKENPAFQHPYIKSIGNAMWLSIVTFTTVGYGDIAVKTRGGRLMISIWMIISMISASSLTAGIATAFTLSSLTHTSISYLVSIKGKRIGGIRGSTGEESVLEYKGKFIGLQDISEGIEMMRHKKIEGVISDSPILKYNFNKNPIEGITIVELGDEKSNYGFCISKEKASYLKDINYSLLILEENGMIKKIFEKYGIN